MFVGIGISVCSLQLGSGAPAVPTGGLMSLTVADATPIDPVVTTAGPNIGSPVGASGSGWVAIVKLKGLTSTAGTVDASKLTLTVSDPGFATDGSATTVTRTITGIAHVRRQYPNGNSKMISTDGSDLTIYVSLDDWVYQGSTITGASIASGFYPSCTAGSAAAVSNLSVEPYPLPIFGWLSFPNEVVGSSVSAESVVFHRHAKQGQQVACLEYTATDGTNSASAVRVSSTALSNVVTGGFRPESWQVSVPTTSLTSGVLCTLDCTIKPWLGTAYTLSSSGFSWPTAIQHVPLRFINDRSGTYGGGYAYVKAGASGGTVSSVAATAAASPFPTPAAAATALKAWNNTNRGHNDLGGGTIRFMDNAGGAQVHTIANSMTNSPGTGLCYFEKDPAAVGAVSITWSAQCTHPDNSLWRNLPLVTGSNTFSIVGAGVLNSIICIDNCSWDNTNARNCVSAFGRKYYRNLSFLVGTCDLSTNNGTDSNMVLLAGCVGTGASKPNDSNQAMVLVGNNIPTYNLRHSSLNTGTDGFDGQIIYNNRCFTATMSGTAYGDYVIGTANVQNVFEQTGAGVCMNFFADNTLHAIANYIEMHTGSFGERASRMYNDVVAQKITPSGMTKKGVSKFCIWDNTNQKADVFSSGSGSVGAWAYLYGVGNKYNRCLFGDVSRASNSLPHNDNTDSPYAGCAWPASTVYNFQSVYSLTQAQIMALFTNWTTAPQAVPAAGGNYKPVSGAAAYFKNAVPAGEAVLTYDLAGVARPNDGTGCVGPYEF